MKNKRLFFLFSLIFTLLLLAFFWNKNSNKGNNWQFYVEDQIGAKSKINFGKDISFDEKSLFFSDSGNTIYALNKQTGQVLWTREIQDHSPFKVNIDKDSVYVASFDSHIYRLDKNTGYIIWAYPIPNQYWPETGVFFDENDQYVFFADRGGFLRALDKKDGKVVWQRQFQTINNTINFVEGSIHFGAIKQNENSLFIKHYPSKQFYIINKNDGLDSKELLKQEEVEKMFENLFVFLNPTWFSFDKHNVLIKNNVIDQPNFKLLNEQENEIWTYRSEYRINPKSIYQDENRLYYLNGDNTILNSLLISKKDPNDNKFKKLNFKLIENFTAHFPYKNSNPQVEASKSKHDLALKLKKLQHKISFFIHNLEKLGEFNITQEEKNGYVEFSIGHEQNFYNNPFTQVDIIATFTDQEEKQIEVKGFYYDHNQWKVRVKLDPGLWNWQIKTKTPYWTDKQTGNSEINQEKSMKKLVIKDSWFLDEDDQIFWPIGLQDVILDSSRDGNPLNQMPHAANSIASKNPEDFRFLEFSDYLDLYVEEAKINFFRYGPDNWMPSIWKNLSDKDNFAMNINGNLQGDIILNELRERNVRAMMSIFSFYPPYTSQEAFAKKSNRRVLEQYLDYVIARYAVLVDIWEIGNEALPPLNWLNFISNYLHDHDPYKHPVTSSLEQPLLENSNLLSIHWFAPTPENNLKLIEQVDHLKTKDNWEEAIMISEWGFEKQNQLANSADIMRKFTWLSLFKSMGMIFWNTGYSLYESETNANIYLGPIERSYLKEIYNFFPKLNYPVQENCQILEEKNLAFCSLKNDDYHLIYLLKKDENKDLLNNKFLIEIKQSGLLEIINPKNGQILESKEIGESVKEISLPVFEDDLAIKITYQN